MKILFVEIIGIVLILLNAFVGNIKPTSGDSLDGVYEFDGSVLVSKVDGNASFLSIWYGEKFDFFDQIGVWNSKKLLHEIPFFPEDPKLNESYGDFVLIDVDFDAKKELIIVHGEFFQTVTIVFELAEGKYDQERNILSILICYLKVHWFLSILLLMCLSRGIKKVKIRILSKNKVLPITREY